MKKQPMKIKLVHIIEDLQVVRKPAEPGGRGAHDVEERRRLTPKFIHEATAALLEKFPNIPWTLKDNSSHHLVYIAECDADMLEDAKVVRDRPVELVQCTRDHITERPAPRRIMDNPQA